MNPLNFHVEREIVIRAQLETVWRYFEDSERFAKWWGEGSTIDAREGGAIKICYPDGSTASGEIKEWQPKERIVFSFGYDDPAKPIAPGGSLVTVLLSEEPVGTRLSLRHDLGDDATRDQHIAGWRFQLSTFSRLACDEQQAGAEKPIDQWYAAWNEADIEKRESILANCASDQVQFLDAYGVTNGVDDLAQHIHMARMHMPLRIEKEGQLRHSQGTVLSGWVVRGPDEKAVMHGTNVFDMAPDERIARVVGIAAR